MMSEMSTSFFRQPTLGERANQWEMEIYLTALRGVEICSNPYRFVPVSDVITDNRRKTYTIKACGRMRRRVKNICIQGEDWTRDANIRRKTKGVVNSADW
jgi:hypothetical protein